ncbi:MAG: rhodanese-like domain-containing protein [Pseudomonadota bacterium]
MSDTPFLLPSVSAAEALALAQSGEAILIDLRKPPAVARDGRRAKGALIRDPFTFGHDDPLMADERPLIAFCVHGHEVSQFASALLMVHGCDARYVTGGFEALVEAGIETETAK